MRLKLVHRVDLDRNPNAATPDDHSVLGALPPELRAAGALPAITAGEDAITFLGDDGRVAARIPLKDDPNLVKDWMISENQRAAAVGSMFAPGIRPHDEKGEGGGWPCRWTVYDRSGRVLYTTTQGADSVIELSDSGAMVVRSIHTGRITLVDQTTGADGKRFQFLGPFGSGPAQVTISANGERILVAAATTSLDGDRSIARYYQNPADYLARAVSEVWVALYDRAGREIWRTKLPEAAKVDSVGVSDDGALAFVHTVVSKKSPLMKPGRIGNLGFILDGKGDIIARSEQWGGGAFGAMFSAAHGGFLLGGDSSPFLGVAGLDGSRRELLEDEHLIPGLDEFYIDHNSAQPCRAVFLGHRKNRLILVLTDHEGKALLVRNVGGTRSSGRADRRPGHDEDDDGDDVDHGPEFPADPPSVRRTYRADVHLSPDGQYVSVRVERELKVYRILLLPARKGRRDDDAPPKRSRDGEAIPVPKGGRR